MRIASPVPSSAKNVLLLCGLLLFTRASAQSNVNIRVMAANLNGNSQKYEPFALRIFSALKPDVVAIQEFNYTSTNGVNVNNAAAFREMVDLGFGTNFYYFRENISGIPNGIISRYPFITTSNWVDPQVGNRGFAWAQIDLPGTNDLYIVSVHFLTSGDRTAEAVALKAQMQAVFTNSPWIIVAGDFNAGSRTEGSITTFNGYLTDAPIPVDNNGNSFTSMNRNSPHDFVLPSLALTNFETATVFPTLNYPNGLVFDSRVYTSGTQLADNFPSVQLADSGLAQHMAVMKDFSIPSDGTNVIAPVITSQPQGRTNAVGASISFAVTATGSSPLAYQWFFNGANIFSATTNPFTLAGAQLTNNGNYFVIITNVGGSATSSVAVLLTTNAPPSITTPPSPQTVLAGQNVTFTVSATGTPPLIYQWSFNGTNIFGATTSPLALANVQFTNAGNYSVVITNSVGSVTSSVAALTVLVTNPAVFALWNFNSVPPDANTGTGSTLPAIGSGTASTVGGIAPSFIGGDPVLDPAPVADNSAWTTTTYPASAANNKTAGVQFAVSTAGRQNIAVSYSIRSSNTGGRYFRVQYSTNGGAAFLDSPAVITLTAGATYFVFTNSLSALAGVNNNSNFVFRLVAEFQSTATGSGSAAYIAANTGSTYATTGTTRFDMVSVSGTSIITATPAVLSAAAISGAQFSFTVTGSPVANYIVQTTTNLAAANWAPIFTNASPFNFSETVSNAPQKFYRAVSQ